MKINCKILKCLLSLSFVKLIFIGNQALAMEDDTINIMEYQTAVANATSNLFKYFQRKDMDDIVAMFNKYAKNNVMAYKDYDGQKYMFLNGLFIENDSQDLYKNDWKVFDCKKVIENFKDNGSKKTVFIWYNDKNYFLVTKEQLVRYLSSACDIFGKYYGTGNDIFAKIEKLVKGAKDTLENENTIENFRFVHLYANQSVPENKKGEINIPANLFHTEIMYIVMKKWDSAKKAKYGIFSVKSSCRNCSKVMSKYNDEDKVRKVFLSIGGLGMSMDDLTEYSQNFHIATQYLTNSNSLTKLIVSDDERKYLLNSDNIKNQPSTQYTQVFYLTNYYRIRTLHHTGNNYTYFFFPVNQKIKEDNNYFIKNASFKISNALPLVDTNVVGGNVKPKDFVGLIKKNQYNRIMERSTELKKGPGYVNGMFSRSGSKGYNDESFCQQCKQITLVSVKNENERFFTPDVEDLYGGVHIGYENIYNSLSIPK